MKRFILTCVTVGMLSVASIASADDHVRPDYTLHSGDTVAISVVNKMGVVKHTADVNGRFTMPMIGQVDVSGKTLNVLQQELTERLSRYIKSPEVIVNIVDYGGVRVKVLGKVHRPGEISLKKNYTLLDAIAKAGGFSRRAAKRRVLLIHAGETLPYVVVNVQDILRGKKNSVNPILREDDLVYVESNGKM